MATKNKGKGMKLSPFLIAISIPISIFTIYVGFRVYSTQKILIPISVFAMLAGLIYEARQLTENWKSVLGVAWFSFILSFFAFMQGKKEVSYVLEDHIEIWPYIFMLIFIIIEIVINEKKIVQKLTVGITLLQSIAVVYWVIDTEFWRYDNMVIKVLIVIGICFSLITIYNALNVKVISQKSRLILSIWSSIIMVLFAFDNIDKVYQNVNIEGANDIIQVIFILLQFFLLGVSSIYIVQNFPMLYRFFPGKGAFFNDEYFKGLKTLEQEHISRYSMEPVSRLHVLICILFTSAIFSMNYCFKLMPRNFLIWLVFVLFPICLYYINKLRESKPMENR